MPTKTPSTTSARWTTAEAERELGSWRRSGKPLAAYARECGVDVQRLHWWKRRLGADASAAVPEGPAFAAAFIRTSPVAVTLRLGADLTLDIADPAAVSAEWLATFAAALLGSTR